MAFWRRKRAPDVPDELLERVQKGVIAALGVLQTQHQTLAAQVQLISENATEARKLEQRLASTNVIATSTRTLLESELARIDQGVNQLRGTITGGTRGRGRGGRAEQIGLALIEQLGDEERAAQLVAEIANRRNGHGPQLDDPDHAIGG